MPIVSIIIPAFKEEKYLLDTLVRLSDQTVWQSVEVIISEYDPEGTGRLLNLIRNNAPTTVRKQTRFMNVDKKGIGYARHMGALQAKSQYLMSFDADAYFKDNDSIHRLLAPLMNGDYIATYGSVDIPDNDPASKHFGTVWYDIMNTTQKTGFSKIAHECGLTIKREAYFAVGGFPDVQSGEAARLSVKLMRKYGSDKIKFINTVHIFQSGRRMSDDSIFAGNDYNFAYR